MLTEGSAVSSPASRAEELARCLAAAGFRPNTSDHTNLICIETDVPGQVSPESWRALLTVLEAADRFGLMQSAKGLTVWAAVRKHPRDG